MMQRFQPDSDWRSVETAAQLTILLRVDAPALTNFKQITSGPTGLPPFMCSLCAPVKFYDPEKTAIHGLLQ
jgi:hypothetical protein